MWILWFGQCVCWSLVSERLNGVSIMWISYWVEKMRAVSLWRKQPFSLACRCCSRTFVADSDSTSKLQIFDRQRKRAQRDRAAWFSPAQDPLLHSVSQNLVDRLQVRLRLVVTFSFRFRFQFRFRFSFFRTARRLFQPHCVWEAPCNLSSALFPLLRLTVAI